MKKLSALIVKQNKDLAAVEEKSSTIDVKIKDLQEKIMQIGGIRLRTQKSVVDGIQDQIETITNLITRLHVEKTSREKNLCKLKTSIEKKEAELIEAETEITELLENVSNGRENASSLKVKVQQAKAVLSEKEEELESITKNLNEKNEQVVAMKKRVV